MAWAGTGHVLVLCRIVGSGGSPCAECRPQPHTLPSPWGTDFSLTLSLGVGGALGSPGGTVFGSAATCAGLSFPACLHAQMEPEEKRSSEEAALFDLVEGPPVQGPQGPLLLDLVWK